MSEYQFYEFQAIDRPLNEREQADIDSLSSRVDLSPHRAVFTYSYGSFHGDPVKILEKYFDALLYLAHWGSRQLHFRLPRSLVDPKALAPYCMDDVICTSTTVDFIILSFCFDEEEPSGWIEGEGLLSALLPLRQLILEGDLRVLYLAWLKANRFTRGTDPDLLEPPVPTGLRNLSKPLSGFVKLFEIDNDLIAVAAEASPDAPIEEAPDLERLIPGLSEAEREDFLRRIVRGDSSVQLQLRLRLKEICRVRQAPANTTETASRRRASELIELAAERVRKRDQRMELAKEQARVRRLEQLAPQAAQLWSQVIALVDQKQIKAYDQAVKMLQDLRELAEYHNQLSGFEARLREIQEKYRNLSGLGRRLEGAGLIAKVPQ